MLQREPRSGIRMPTSTPRRPGSGTGKVDTPPHLGPDLGRGDLATRHAVPASGTTTSTSAISRASPAGYRSVIANPWPSAPPAPRPAAARRAAGSARPAPGRRPARPRARRGSSSRVAQALSQVGRNRSCSARSTATSSIGDRSGYQDSASGEHVLRGQHVSSRRRARDPRPTPGDPRPALPSSPPPLASPRPAAAAAPRPRWRRRRRRARAAGSRPPPPTGRRPPVSSRPTGVPAVLGPDEDVEELRPVRAGEVVGVPDHGGVPAEAGRADRAEDGHVVAGPVEQVGGDRVGLRPRRGRPGGVVAGLQRPHQQVVHRRPVLGPVRPHRPAGRVGRRVRRGVGLDVLHQQPRPGRRGRARREPQHDGPGVRGARGRPARAARRAGPGRRPPGPRRR